MERMKSQYNEINTFCINFIGQFHVYTKDFSSNGFSVPYLARVHTSQVSLVVSAFTVISIELYFI